MLSCPDVKQAKPGATVTCEMTVARFREQRCAGDVVHMSAAISSSCGRSLEPSGLPYFRRADQ
jgi:hypothetical protein